MKSLIFKELLLLSVQQRRARKIRFNRSATIISGDNSTGKSQVIKSLYTCLGAAPAVGSDLLEAAALKLVLGFSVGNREYCILLDGETYTLFAESEKVLGSYRKVPGGLADDLARIFDFHLEFYTAADEPRVAHPRYLFAPFYIDQDHGWSSTWSSFSKQHSSRRSDTIEYHTGIRPNSYYQAKAQLRELQNEAREPEFQRNTFAKMLEKMASGAAQVDFNLDFDAYSNEIAQLLLECRKLQQQEEDFRERIVALDDERVQLHLEMEIAGKAAIEFQRDFAVAARLPREIECPTCGA